MKLPSEPSLKLFSTSSDHQQPLIMLESGSIDERIAEDVSPTSKDKTRRDATHILDNLFDCDPEDEEDSAFAKAFLELSYIDGLDGMMTLSSDNLHALCSNLSTEVIFIN